MHAGFTEMRNTYGCNFLGHYSGPIPINEKAKKEIERMLTLWSDARKFTVERLKKVEKEDEDEGFLFGKFGIADSFFWPVLWVGSVFLPTACEYQKTFTDLRKAFPDLQPPS